MIDLHAHVLPGLDDGPSTLEGSLDLVRAAKADGIRTLVATPHVREDYPAVRPAELSPRCAELNEQIARNGDGIRVVPGAEVSLTWAAKASPEELQLVTYAQRGSDLLLETPSLPLTHLFHEVVFKIAAVGIRILLAHPEQCPTFQRTPERLRKLTEQGVLLQLNATSLLRQRRSRTRALATRLIEEGVAHAMASDAHSAGSWRPPALAAGVAAAARLDSGRATWMVTDAPAAILAGERLPPAPERSRSLRRALRRR